ncbi:unnamed protein product [Phaedon cochleariae]|uniref:MADF domain-containing protein n=1 Tax=Phaedon cochleariae TaxID=80249 RepID=A0A9N9X0Q0_PHACE|nr:unnamed protein product [Phaedon cochleariae]
MPANNNDELEQNKNPNIKTINVKMTPRNISRRVESRNISVKTKDHNIEQEEVLITLVFERRPLWDHTLPLSQRSKAIKDKLWLEINRMMNGVWSLDQIQRKWKSMKDRYLKLKSEYSEHVPTGSGRDKAKKITWKYYGMLTFLSSVNVPRKTVSSLHEETAERIPIHENTQEANKTSKPRGQKKKRNLDEEILEAIKNTTMPTPQPTQPNDVH